MDLLDHSRPCSSCLFDFLGSEGPVPNNFHICEEEESIESVLEFFEPGKCPTEPGNGGERNVVHTQDYLYA